MQQGVVGDDSDFDCIIHAVRDCLAKNNVSGAPPRLFLDEMPYTALFGSIKCDGTDTGASYIHDSLFPVRTGKRGFVNSEHNTALRVHDIPVVTRAYEESYMRSAIGSECSCVMGHDCECMLLDDKQPFVGMRFQLPNFESSSVVSDINLRITMCVICIRKTTQRLYYDAVYKGVTPACIIQVYGNVFGEPDEYAEEVALRVPADSSLVCMPLPIVSHQRNRYIVRRDEKVYRLKQVRVNVSDF